MRFLVLATLLASCGEAPKTTGVATNDSNEQPKAQTAVGQDPANPDKVVTTAASDNKHAMLIADAAALPTCTAADEGWLIYLKAENAFMACVAGAWEAIDVTTETVGTEGNDGAKGDKGDKGDAGEAGEDSTSTMWLDLVTNKKWIVTILGARAAADSACGGDWALPTKELLLAAANHGLYAGLGSGLAAGYQGGWTSAVYGVANTEYVLLTTPTIGSRSVNDVIGVYCYKQEQ